MLTENKFSKYIVYALGEIALVMIGILLALQVNNWNESKKNTQLVNSYKDGLIENLVKDSIKISQTLKVVRTELEKIRDFERRVSESSEPFDTILKIARYEYNFKIQTQYDYENDTYQVLNSTGHIGLFKNEFIKDLKVLYNLQERAIFSSSHSFETYRNSIAKYAQKYPFSFYTNLIQNNTVAASKVWDNISLPDHATEFNAVIIAKGDNYRLSVAQLPLILEQTTEILANLRDK